jgi:DNA-binding GntR family transcriptional regulator
VGAATRPERLRSMLEPVVTQRPSTAPFTQLEIDQLRIITSWLHHNHREAVVVDLVEGDVDGAVRAIAEAMQQLREVVVKSADDEAQQPSEYSQLPTTDEW